MMILEIGQVCPYSNKCPLNGNCYGTRADRQNKFECEYVKNGKLNTELGYRNPMDKTGRMKVIME